MKRLALLFLALLVVPTAAYAGQALRGTTNLRSSPAADRIYGPGVIGGKAHLVTTGGGVQTSIVTHVDGLKPGTKHAGHIHFGDCSRLFPGEIVYDLEPLTANAEGRAVSRTVVDDSLADLRDGQWWVAVHEGPENATPQTPAIAIGPVIVRDKNDGCPGR